MSNKVNVDDWIGEENGILNNVFVYTASKDIFHAVCNELGCFWYCVVRNILVIK